MTMSPVLVARDGGDHFHFLNTLQTAKLNSEQTNGALTAVEFYAPKNFGPPLHLHDAEDELFYILDGELWLSCGDVEAVHGQGAMAWLPRGLPHTFQVRSETARVLDGLDAVGLRAIPRRARRADRQTRDARAGTDRSRARRRSLRVSTASRCSARRPRPSASRSPGRRRRPSSSPRSRRRARRR